MGAKGRKKQVAATLEKHSSTFKLFAILTCQLKSAKAVVFHSSDRCNPKYHFIPIHLYSFIGGKL
ncbi:hypothetical protein [Sideroxydans sp. CL21]|nr:hypothetical protein [Sideroxydans sp. CL21]